MTQPGELQENRADANGSLLATEMVKPVTPSPLSGAHLAVQAGESSPTGAGAPIATASGRGGPGDSLVGTLVDGRFTVLRALGEGGMGAVYLAEHVALHKRVAIKMLHASLSQNNEMVARFEREAQAMAKLDHENIAKVTDFGRLADGSLFLVLEYVDGEPLRSVITTVGHMPIARGLHIVKQIASALSHAHLHGIVHRDLKPENVILQTKGVLEHAKVIDFGIARLSETSTKSGPRPLTQAGVVFGTPHYMAPEQALGKVVDAAADQYALGVLTFELLTGSKPYTASDVIELLELHVRGPIPTPSQRAPHLSASIDAFVVRMLAKNPRERFGSLQEVIQAIDLLAQEQSAPAIVPLSPHQEPQAADASTQSALSTPTAVLPGAAQKVLGLPVFSLGALGRVPLAALMIVAPLSLWAAITGISSVRTAFAARAVPHAATPQAHGVAIVQSPEISQALALSTRGDHRGALQALRALRQSHPDDLALAYHTVQLASGLGEHVEATAAADSALRLAPQLVEDAAFVRALVAALASPDAATVAERLLHDPRFAGSHAAAEQLAREAIYGPSQDVRRRASTLALERVALMSPELAARIALRTSTECGALRSAVLALERSTDLDGQSDARRLRGGQCAMLRRRELCRCVQR
ncbi:MAG: protein kinase [Deltaproteobacteria bacterium]|nr:protein kinase [Deltaproteobacteria bacterium]